MTKTDKALHDKGFKLISSNNSIYVYRKRYARSLAF